jgi:hypothetical protein
MPAAAPARPATSSFSKISGEYFQCKIVEGSLKDDSGKREMVVTLMREGPGNKFLGNWYKKSALESVQRILESRKKQYFNHAKNPDDPDRDVRDWASSIVETWIEDEGGKAALKGRVRVYDNWLWERAHQAPDELAVSMEGKGRGRQEIIEGQKYNAIYEIPVANGVQWVDYPGNAGMGVQVLESQHLTEEEEKMDPKDVIEALKGMKQEDLQAVREALGVPAPAAVADPAMAKALTEVKESLSAVKAAAEADKKTMSDRLAAVEAEKTALAARVEAHDIKERAMTKEKLADSLLGASKLKDEHKTPTFRATLLGVREYKNGDAVVSEADQMKALIGDREKICVVETAAAPAAGAPVVEAPVEEQHRAFARNLFGVELPKPVPAAAAA